MNSSFPTNIFRDERSYHKHLDTNRQVQLIMLRMLLIVDFICKKHDIRYWLIGGTLLGSVRHGGFIPWDDDIDIGMLRTDYDKFVKVFSKEAPSDLFLQNFESEDFYFNQTCPTKIRDRYSLFVEKHDRQFTKPFQQGIFLDIFPFDFQKQRLFIRYFLKKRLKRLRKIIVSNRAGRLWGRSWCKLFSEEKIWTFHQWLLDKTIDPQSEIVDYGLDTAIKQLRLPSTVFFPLKTTSFEGHIFPCPNDTSRYLRAKYGDYEKLPPEKARVPNHGQKVIPIYNP